MDKYQWDNEHQKILEIIQGKIDFIKNQFDKIGINDKSDAYNRAIIKRLEEEKKFINELLAFLIQTKDLLNDNEHLIRVMSINYRAAIAEREILYQQIETGFEAEIKNVIGAGS
jgi:hypothetical protein